MSAKRLLRALAGDVAERPPFWLMRQAGRYLPEYQRLRDRQRDFLAFCYTPELAIEATLQPLRRFAPDAAILFSDILVLADALGRPVRFEEGRGPVLEPLRRAEEVRALAAGGIGERLAPVFETVRGIAAALPADVALIGFAGAPWTVALYMVEGEGGTDGGRARRWAYEAPDTFAQLIGVLVEATVEYLHRQIDSGAEAVQLFDSWAGLLPAGPFRQWVVAPTAAIVRGLRQRHPAVPVIGFPRGAGLLYAEYVQRTGVTAVGLDAGVPAEWAAAELQPRCPVQGNLDNHLLAVGGEPLDAGVAALLRCLAGGPYIFNLGHGVLPDTPVEHVLRLAERIRSFRHELDRSADA